MTAIAEQDLTQVDLGDLALWADGPRMSSSRAFAARPRSIGARLADHPGESGFWSITRAEDLRGVSLDWETYSSELGGVLVLDDFGIPLEAQRQQMISDGPARATIGSRRCFSAGSRPHGSPSTRRGSGQSSTG